MRTRRRFSSRTRSSNTSVFMLLSLFLVTLVTFLQALVDYLQSLSKGAYMPKWQQILILTVAFLAFLGLLLSYVANSKSSASPIP